VWPWLSNTCAIALILPRRFDQMVVQLSGTFILQYNLRHASRGVRSAQRLLAADISASFSGDKRSPFMISASFSAVHSLSSQVNRPTATGHKLRVQPFARFVDGIRIRNQDTRQPHRQLSRQGVVAPLRPTTKSAAASAVGMSRYASIR